MATITTHTLNGVDGTHAGGIRVTLRNLTTRAILFETETDAGGRLSREFELGTAKSSDTYEIVFANGAYWRSHTRTCAGIRTIDEIVLRFQMSDPDGKYHMPVILSPNAYSTWASG